MFVFQGEKTNQDRGERGREEGEPGSTKDAGGKKSGWARWHPTPPIVREEANVKQKTRKAWITRNSFIRTFSHNKVSLRAIIFAQLRGTPRLNIRSRARHQRILNIMQHAIITQTCKHAHKQKSAGLKPTRTQGLHELFTCQCSEHRCLECRGFGTWWPCGQVC